MMSYSRKHNLNYNNFKQWCYKYKQKHPEVVIEKNPENNFIPLKLKDTPVTPPAITLPRFELNLFFGLIHFRLR